MRCILSPGASWTVPPEWAGTVQVHRLMCPPHHVLRYGALLEVMRVARLIRPDLVHAHYLSHFGIVGGLLTQLAGYHPLVLTAWGSDVLLHSTGRRRSLVGDALRQADCITCDSPHMIPHLVELGANPESIRIINFGVDTKRFTPRMLGRTTRRERGTGDRPTVVSLRNLRPVYDVATLVRAVPTVLKAVPDAQFLIVGEGSERKRLEALVESLGLAPNVLFAGAVAHEMLPDILNGADVYVSTSRSDAGIAASTAEAMACGLPAVVTDFGDNGSWVRNGETGYLFPCGDHHALSERLIPLLRDVELRQRLGLEGRRTIVERNSYQGEMNKMERIYLELIERCKS